MTAAPALAHRSLPSTDEIAAAVFAAVENNLGPFDQEIDRDTQFIDLGARSLELVSVAFELEDRYDIEIHQKSLNNFKTIGQAIQIVTALVEARGARS